MNTEVTPDPILPENLSASGLSEPGKGSRYLLAFLMLFMLLPVQILIGLPLIFAAFLIITGGDLRPQVISAVLNDAMTSEWAIWMTLAVAALAAALAIGLAFLWPRLARSGGRRFTFREWFAADMPDGRLRLWMIPLITFGAMVVAGLGVSSVMGEAEVNVQMLLFGTPALSILSTIVVSTLVPLAEELTFRGALYTALLGDQTRRESRKNPHLMPFLVTSIAFALVHLLAGFETIAALFQVLLLSLYITFLRWRTGSVLPPIIAHATWNLTAALMMAYTVNLPF